ncbi:YheC/YheD family protein [Paludifilum halophilum]|uniref:ATP-grasp domain-containing protein n=1 Tax=Paludifilum halophilum TaxID=1642702 RepID=A0A235BB83_9BACL|nr:YheC/YheD family protein [Paludifilum halophilum]OYD09551.1 hypothetical protein CHM34_00595 [Paludifilum halophilum]
MAHDVGVLISRQIFQDCLRGRSPYEPLALYDHFGRKEGFQPIFFTLEDIFFQDLTVRGFLCNKEGGVCQKRLPLPTLIHNRIKPAFRDSRELARLRQLSETVLFNADNRLNKWTVHRIWSRESDLLAHLPETIRYHPSEVKPFLLRRGSVYLKPCHKSLAIGIFRMDLEENEKSARISVPGQEEGQIYSLERALSFLKEQIGNTPYLVQQSLPLIRIDHHPVDIRVAVQRGRDGEWRVSGMVARLGPVGGIATNVAVGGRAQQLLPVLRQAGFQKAEGLCCRIGEMVVKAAEVLSRRYPELADLGFDVAVEPGGRLWIIEVNARDLRITFHQARDLESWRRTFARPMEYASYLLRKQDSSRPSVAVLTPGTLPVRGRSSGSVETTVRETAERLAEERRVYVLGMDTRVLKKSCPVEVRASNRRQYWNQAFGHLRRLRSPIIQVENRPAVIGELRSICSQSRLLLYLHSDTFIRPPYIRPATLRKNLDHCDAIVTNSAHLKEQLIRMFPRCRDRIHVVAPGVNLNRFRSLQDPRVQEQRSQRRQAMGLIGKKVLLFVGRMIPQKGLHVLLKGLARIRERHPETHLLIVGGSHYGRMIQTPYVRMIREQMKPFRDMVTWIPFVPHSQMPSYYQAADLLVTPSLVREAFGLVNVEGMATGLPVVSVGIGGIPEVVEDGKTGVLLSRRELAPRLPEVCSDLFGNPQRMKRLGEAGRKRAEEYFGWDRTAEGMERLYKDLLKDDTPLSIG